MSSFVENINIVAGVTTSLTKVADKIEDVKITADNIEAVQDVADNMADVNTVADNMADVNATGSNIVNVNTVADNMADVNATGSNIVNVNTVADNMAGVTLVADNMADVLETELRAWEAEASQLTADSYATEPEGTLVKQYTSNGDGTFTITDTMEYSSLHWSNRAYDLVTEGVIDDTQVLPDRTYSSDKIMQLQASTAQAIANLSTAQGQIVNTNTPVFEEIPIAPAVGVLDFTVTSQSTDDLIFELNDADNLITFKQETSYSFISSVTLKSNVAGSREVTFNIVDNATNNVITTESMVVTIPAGVNETFTLNTLVQAPSYPVTVRIEVMCSGEGYELKRFSSILISQGGNISSSLIDYDNTSSGLTAEFVQDAIDELTVSDVTLNGIKNFTSSPIVPTPEAGFQVANKAYVDSALPAGFIGLWSGPIASIPTGWVLCNGANGTPDLRDRFVIGAGSTYAVDVTGGSKDAVVVAHTHTQNAHNHTASTNSTGAHTHRLPTYGSGTGVTYKEGGGKPLYNLNVNTSSSGAHSHTVAVGNATPAINSTGVSGVDKNLPPYYALAYIMKT